MLIALTRRPSRRLTECELTFLAREPIDVELAGRQHRQYEAMLESWGAQIERLRDEPDSPDGAFVEDTAVVLDECAILASMGAESRRGEVESAASALAKHRELFALKASAKLDGGDVLRIDRELFIGVSTRTNELAIEDIEKIVRRFGYGVVPVRTTGCLHLKSACTYLGRGMVLINRTRVDETPFQRFQSIAVPEEEPAGANALVVGKHVTIPTEFPRTAELVSRAGFAVGLTDISEFLKAEAGLTCLSIVFEAGRTEIVETDTVPSSTRNMD